MSYLKSHGLVELSDLDLGQVTGSFPPPAGLGFQPPPPGGMVFGRLSGPPLQGELGAGYTGPRGGTIGGSITSDGHDWMGGLSAAMTSSSGKTTLSGSGSTDGHDWSVKGSIIFRF
jgi:hypothetical protein